MVCVLENTFPCDNKKAFQHHPAGGQKQRKAGPTVSPNHESTTIQHEPIGTSESKPGKSNGPQHAEQSSGPEKKGTGTPKQAALTEAYGRFAPVMEYLLVLDEDPREGRVVTTRVRDLWSAQDEKGPGALFTGALSTPATVGRCKYVLFAVPEGLEHHSLLDVVDEVAYRAAAGEADTLGPVLATLVWELHDVLVNAWPPSGVSYREVRVVRAYRAAMAALVGYERYPRDCEPATVGFPHYVGERVTPAL